MSDLGRKDISSKVGETITPESQKSPLDKITESATSAGDKIAGAVQPGDKKSTSQKLSDVTSSHVDSAESGGKTYLDQAKELAHEAIEKAQPYIDSAQKTAQPYIDTASKAVSDLVSGEKK